MTEENKKYEPPKVKEVGSVFEQAMGASSCINGPRVATGTACQGGRTPAGNCPGGGLNQACIGGSGDTGGCSGGARG